MHPDPLYGEGKAIRVMALVKYWAGLTYCLDGVMSGLTPVARALRHSRAFT